MSAIESESDCKFYGSSDSDEEIDVAAGIFEPYLNEPLIPDNEGIRGENQIVTDETKDIDGLTGQELENRYLKAKPGVDAA